MSDSSISGDCKARIEGIAWRRLREKLELCNFLIEEGWMSKIPSKSTFHAVWRTIDSSILERWIIMLGEEVASRKEVKGLAADSSGFNSRNVKLVCGVFLNGLKEC